MLILGNHDLDRDALREAGFTTQYSLALCATDPPLVLSHYPLHHLPVGAMNVHGHLHNQFETIVRISALQIILPSWDPGPPPAARPLEQIFVVMN